MCTLINTPSPEGVIINQPISRFLGVIFDGDHDFEGPRAPKAHLDTVNRNQSHHLGRPFKCSLAGILPLLLAQGATFLVALRCEPIVLTHLFRTTWW